MIIHKTHYIATYVDYDQDGNCDGKARLLGVYNSQAQAYIAVANDIKQRLADNEELYHMTEDEALQELAVHDEERLNGCEWSVDSYSFIINTDKEV